MYNDDFFDDKQFDWLELAMKIGIGHFNTFSELEEFQSITDFIFRMLTENVNEKIPFTRKLLPYFDQMMNIIHNNYLPLEKKQPSDK